MQLSKFGSKNLSLVDQYRFVVVAAVVALIEAVAVERFADQPTLLFAVEERVVVVAAVVVVVVAVTIVVSLNYC